MIDEKEVTRIVDITIRELKKSHLLKNPTQSVYDDITSKLFNYYKHGEADEEIRKALDEFADDYYINIIPFYYKNRYTIENIAEMLNVDVSTVVRNKKRLCTSIFLELNQ